MSSQFFLRNWGKVGKSECCLGVRMEDQMNFAMGSLSEMMYDTMISSWLREASMVWRMEYA